MTQKKKKNLDRPHKKGSNIYKRKQFCLGGATSQGHEEGGAPKKKKKKRNEKSVLSSEPGGGSFHVESSQEQGHQGPSATRRSRPARSPAEKKKSI